MKKKSVLTIMFLVLLAVGIIIIAPADFVNSGLLRAILLAAPFVAFYFLSKRGLGAGEEEAANTSKNIDSRALSILLWGGVTSLIFAIIWLLASALIFSAPLYWGGFSPHVAANIMVIPFSGFLALGIIMLGLRAFLSFIQDQNDESK